MKFHKVFLWCFWAVFLLFQTVDADSREEFTISHNDAKQRDFYQGSEKFECPSLIGRFSYPGDCSKYYICANGKALDMKCRDGPMMMKMMFDILTKRCLPASLATCGDDKDKTKSTASTQSIVTTPQTTTPNGDDITCSAFFESLPHPNDCSKYYSCFMFRPSLKTCTGKELFDAIRKECKPEKEVHCGNRRRPDGFATTAKPNKTSTQSIATTTETAPETTTASITTETISETTTKTAPEGTTVSITNETISETTTETAPETTTESITTEIISETTTETAPDTTTESITTETTTESITTETTTESITTETTTESITTETTTDIIRPTGPPEHNCDEDDLDCIITETGDVDKWFICKQDVGFYPHESSDKLFIFCMNWIPSVKKCGLDYIFSKERSTCILN